MKKMTLPYFYEVFMNFRLTLITQIIRLRASEDAGGYCQPSFRKKLQKLTASPSELTKQNFI